MSRRSDLYYPSINSLLHQNMTGDGENELLRFALRIGNEGAVNILTTLKKINKHAADNDYYETIWGAYGVLNLKKMVLGQTATVKKITEDEQRMVDLFRGKYKDSVEKSGGIEAVFKELQVLLVTRYKKEPAFINLSENKQIKLPHDKKDYQKILALYDEDEDFAHRSIRAYYKNPIHCILRILVKQKFWLEEKNKSMPDGSTYVEHWSMQDEYLSNIAYLYLAASDRKTGKNKDESGEERVTLFIKLYSSLCGLDYQINE